MKGDPVIMGMEEEIGRTELVGDLSTQLGTDKTQGVSDSILPGISAHKLG